MAARVLGLKVNDVLYRRSLTAATRTSSTSSARRRRSATALAASEACRASTSTAEERRVVSAGHGRGAGARLRGHRQQRALRARARARTSELTGTPGQPDGRPRSGRAGRSTIQQRRPARDGRDVVPDARPHDPGERRAGARARPSRSGTRRARRRSSSTRTTGGVLAMAQAAGLRREPVRRDERRALQRDHAVTRRLRAGLGVQGRDDRAARSPSSSSRRARGSRCPYSIHVADRVIHDAEPRGTETMTVGADPAALVERRHGHDRAHAPRRDAA